MGIERDLQEEIAGTSDSERMPDVSDSTMNLPRNNLFSPDELNDSNLMSFLANFQPSFEHAALLNQLQLAQLQSFQQFLPFSAAAFNGSNPVVKLRRPNSANDKIKQNTSKNLPTAYCPICKKTVCNAYFLKSHLKNKHNIDDPAQMNCLVKFAQESLPSSSSKHFGSIQTPNSNPYLNMNENLLAAAMAACDPQALYGSLISPNVATSQMSNNSSLSLTSRLETDPSASASRSVIVNNTDNESIPRLQDGSCGQKDDQSWNSEPVKSLSNSQNLNEPTNSVVSVPNVDAISETNGPISLQRQVGNALFSKKTVEDEEEDDDDDEDASPSAHRCFFCPKKFTTSSYLTQHVENHHQNLLASINPLNVMLSNSSLVKTFGLPQSIFPPESVESDYLNNKEAKSVKRKNLPNEGCFCEICKKMVCNKYFLRTHMLKMHAIVIDEMKYRDDPEVLAKEAEGKLQFRCNKCGVTVMNRSLLQDHKRDTHGITVNASSCSNQEKESQTFKDFSANEGPSASAGFSQQLSTNQNINFSEMFSHIQQIASRASQQSLQERETIKALQEMMEANGSETLRSCHDNSSNSSSIHLEHGLLQQSELEQLLMRQQAETNRLNEKQSYDSIQNPLNASFLHNSDRLLNINGNEELAPLDARIDSLKQSVIETVPLSNEAFEATCSSDYEEMDEVMAATTAVARQMIEANRRKRKHDSGKEDNEQIANARQRHEELLPNESVSFSTQEDIGKIEAHSEKDSMAVIIAGQNDIEKTLKLKTNFKHKDTVALDHSSYTSASTSPDITRGHGFIRNDLQCPYQQQFEVGAREDGIIPADLILQIPVLRLSSEGTKLNLTIIAKSPSILNNNDDSSDNNDINNKNSSDNNNNIIPL
ncbi:unnamed protein product [Dracunculus medinensis]|uniref:C2H2-type domain-containing protein n=1 Tax=Dracunculus medinensis TaxID=318479 RepID=A0A0N4UID2_DRAME|nr:unnamed protein product [Dracunculus medinensis]